jgi:hypothetical protein
MWVSMARKTIIDVAGELNPALVQGTAKPP